MFFEVQNETYKTNLQKLQKILFVKFTQDGMVIPKESEVNFSINNVVGTVIKLPGLERLTFSAKLTI